MVWLLQRYICINSHWPIVFANLLFAEYLRDMHWRILSGVMPPPLSEVQFVKELTQGITKTRNLPKTLRNPNNEQLLGESMNIPSTNIILPFSFLLSRTSTLTYVAPLQTWRE